MTITLRASDADKDSLTYEIVANPAHGTLSGTGYSRTYTSKSGYSGRDTILFRVHDGKAYSSNGRVAITVTPVNHAPTAVPERVLLLRNTAKIVTLMATDQDGDKLTYRVVAEPTHGKLSGSGPSLTYTPNPNYVGADSFMFRANDGRRDSDLASVSITVRASNKAPVASAQKVTTSTNRPLSIKLAAEDDDGDELTYILVTSPAHGKLTGLSSDTVVYNPESDYGGPDSFTFRANDGLVDSDITTVSITVGG